MLVRKPSNEAELGGEQVFKKTLQVCTVEVDVQIFREKMCKVSNYF